MSLVVDPMRLGVAAEFETPEELLAAVGELRARGYRRIDAYTPYPLEELDELLPARRTRLPWLAFAAGIAGAATGYLVQWYCNTWDFPINVGGRPLHSAPAFVVITFETMVLFAATALFFGTWLGARLPEVWNPLFELPGFERASVDRFWLGVDCRDPRLGETDADREDEREVEGVLSQAGALQVVHPRRVEPSVVLPEPGS